MAKATSKVEIMKKLLAAMISAESDKFSANTRLLFFSSASVVTCDRENSYSYTTGSFSSTAEKVSLESFAKILDGRIVQQSFRY